MLIVVHHRLFEAANQFRFDVEAVRRANILQVNTAKGRGHLFHHVYELLGIFGIHQNRRGADAHELIVDHRFSFHHRHAGHRPDIPQSQNSGAVGKNAHTVADICVNTRHFRFFLDDFADPRHSRGVNITQIFQSFQGAGAAAVDFAAQMAVKDDIFGFQNFYRRPLPDGVFQPIQVFFVMNGDGNFPERVIPTHKLGSNIADDGAFLTDHC